MTTSSFTLASKKLLIHPFCFFNLYAHGLQIRVVSAATTSLLLWIAARPCNILLVWEINLLLALTPILVGRDAASSFPPRSLSKHVSVASYPPSC